MMSADAHIKAICKLFNASQSRHDRYTLFSDCLEVAAISLSNATDFTHRDTREARYMEIVGRYERDVIDTFVRIFSEVTMAMEAEPSDILGRVFGELELGNAARGQFFTPYTVCRFMAETMLGEHMDAIIDREGFITVNEPACGSGAMVVALAEAMRGAEINYQRHMHVTAIDIDPRAVHMAYIQFSLLHIPAVVILGNALSLETRQQWFTPAHVLGGWNSRIAERVAREAEIARSDSDRIPVGIKDASEIFLPEKQATCPPPIQLTLF
ncbi:N-6 DNA methylase [Hephaestia caeni]|uniref:site-specific DNA-methyltransferase (adenine-specific) n=1 Tax=Hephaestia caeni TaxID=645617 RepID=A0A397PBS9_9SPHN|nr:class I SAM-dependent methyltransferase [Hephaestia caeni]RIA46408.1 N-6 DNA methylase [Hephaestia caeni]